MALPTAAHAKGGPVDDSRIDELLAGMSLEQKIGQLFVAVGYGATADAPHPSNTSTTGVDTIAEIVRTHHVGGLIYFVWSDNLQDIEQIATLSNDVQDAALGSSGIPLVISADEERGIVYRLPAPRPRCRGRWRSAPPTRMLMPARPGTSSAPRCAPPASIRPSARWWTSTSRRRTR